LNKNKELVVRYDTGYPHISSLSAIKINVLATASNQSVHFNANYTEWYFRFNPTK